jgi:alpha-amylase
MLNLDHNGSVGWLSGPLLASLLLATGCNNDTTSTPAPVAKADWHQSVAYEIFVRSFYDSDGDGTGDLAGVTQKLDYLQDLGVDALWLMPIQPSPTYHGYAVSDYTSINPDYGTLEDFKTLIAEAHKRHIKVIPDLVINHTAEQHPWFQGMLAGDAAYQNFYRCGDTALDGNWGEVAPGKYCYYSFGPQSGLPDLNYQEPEVRNEVKKIADFWLATGVDGFRLDVAQDIGDGDDAYTIAWWQEFDTHVKLMKPDAFVVGEVNYDSLDGNTKIAPFLAGMTSAFNFPLYNELVTAAAGLPKDLLALVNPTRELYATVNPDYVDSTIIGNHDRNRIASELNFIDSKIRRAVTLQMTLPGTPFIYYGDELGMRGGHDLQADPHKREPFDWYAAGDGSGMTRMTQAVYGADAKNLLPYDGISLEEEQGQAGSLFEYYKQLIQIRKSNAILFTGQYQRVGTPAGSYGYQVTAPDADYNLLVVHNRLADQELALNITGETTELLSQKGYQSGDKLTIPAYSSVILKTKGQAAAVELGSIPDDAMDTSDVTLDIQVHVPADTPSDAKLYMPNSDDGWDPATITVDAATTLERVDATTFHIRVTRPRGTRLEYKFFRGGWDSSETDAEGNWTGNRIFLFVDDSSQVEVNIQGWRDIDYKG